MAEKMLVTQALDERDLLAIMINDKIAKANFVDYAKNSEDKVGEKRITREEFAKNAKASYEQIIDLIKRYQKINDAILLSDAQTMIDTSYGSFTVAGAIAYHNRVLQKDHNAARRPDFDAVNANGSLRSKTDFEFTLGDKLDREYNRAVAQAEDQNKVLQKTADNMRLGILEKDNQTGDDAALEVVKTYVRESTAEIVDPLDAVKMMQDLDGKLSSLMVEIKSKVKVSNATTYIEI